jgi:hypothetical protein
MAENKTKPSDASVEAFIADVEHAGRREDALGLLDTFAHITGEKPVLWGGNMIGFGSYGYTYDSGRSGTMFRSGFSPRKANLSLYVLGCTSSPEAKAKQQELLDRLGPHRRGVSCLYVTRLNKVDTGVLEELIAFDKAAMDAKYPLGSA